MAHMRGVLMLTTGISVITCTNRPHFLFNMLQNYRRQKWANKEWIIVVNKDRVNLTSYKKIAAQYKNVHLYQLPSRCTLGHCLNFASARARYPYIAKMDDDEYYAPNYLVGMMLAF